MERWDAFTPAELSELSIALDHRIAEAEGKPDGSFNAYVWVTETVRLENEIAEHLGDEPRLFEPETHCADYWAH